jgi:hypothetical protein
MIFGEIRDLRVEIRDLRQDFLEERRRSDARFERMFKQIHTVGLAIVKTLNRHTRILEHNSRILGRIDRRFGTWDNGRPGPNGRG